MSKQHTQIKSRIISSEESTQFYPFDVNKVVVHVPQPSSVVTGKGVWIKIQYDYDGHLDYLKVQTPELMSNGLYRYDKDCPIKFSVIMTNRHKHEIDNGKVVSEEEKDRANNESATLQIFTAITEKIKQEMLKQGMVAALKRTKDNLWETKIRSMEILKTQRDKIEEEGLQTWFLNAKLSTNWIQTRFYTYFNQDDEPMEQVFEDFKEEMLQNDIKCKAISLIIIDSVFIGVNMGIQVKLAEAIITELQPKISDKPCIIVRKRQNGNPQIPMDN